MDLEVVEQLPSGAVHPTPLLFVHGAWHGAWCWEYFLPYFARHGYVSYALSLRGHGKSAGRERLRWHSAAHGYVADVAQVVARLPTPPVLVGHSMGGYVVQKYLETAAAPAAVLLASIPVSGILGFGIRYGMRHPWPFIKAHLLLNPWYMVATPALAQDAFFSPRLPPEDFARHYARLQPESFRMELETLALNLPRPQRIQTPIPMLVLGAANDRVFSPDEVQATARAYRTHAEIFPNMAHDMMLDPGWQKVADRILSWLQEQGF